MNFVYSIIVNYRFPLDRLDVYILYLKLAEGPRGGANARLPPPPLAAPLIIIEALTESQSISLASFKLKIAKMIAVAQNYILHSIIENI